MIVIAGNREDVVWLEVGVADAESAESVIIWHERRCETEVAVKVLGVVRWWLLLVVIVLPVEALVRCPRRAKPVEVCELFLGSRDHDRFGVFVYGHRRVEKRQKR